MKRLYIFILSLICAVSLLAQSPANRTATTIVADVLAQMPAKNQTEFDKLMTDLSSTGAEGVSMLVNRLNAPGQGSNAAVDYALSGREMRANFYKCGDLLPTPHFLSWNPIDTPAPSFHQPSFFGKIKFE